MPQVFNWQLNRMMEYPHAEHHPDRQFAFVFNLNRCIGCHACTIACKAEHDIPVGVNRCWVKTVEKGRFPDAQRLFLPVLCNQCEDAPCMNICPTSALFRRRDGIVDLHGDACIGCKFCELHCPDFAITIKERYPDRRNKPNGS